MTKAQLKAAYLKARGKFEGGELYTNEYALALDTMLSEYFGLPVGDLPENVE